MIVVSGTLTFAPAGLDAAIAAMNDLAATTRTEDGCLEYAYWQSTTDPGVFRAYEEWADDDSINAHMGSAHMAEFMGAVLELGITGAEVWRFDGATRSKLL